MKNSTLQFFCIVSFLVFIMFFPAQAKASVYDIFPTVDQVYHHDSWPGGYWNYWDVTPNPNLAVHSYDYESGFGSSSSSYYTNLQYSMISFGPGETITSAKIYLDLLSISGDSNATATINGNAGSDNLLIRPLGWNSFDVMSLITSGISTLSFNTGVTDPDNAGVNVTFGSPAGGLAPYLQIVTSSPSDPPVSTPEPGTLLLMGIGAASMAFMRKRAKRS